MLNFTTHQTKILEARTNLSACVFEALFRCVITLFGQRIVENAEIMLKCWFVLPKSSFGEHKLSSLSRWLWNRAILLATWLSSSNDDDGMSTCQRNSLSRITRWWCIMVAFLCVCWNHKMMIAFRCACRPQTMMISWWWHVDVSVDLRRWWYHDDGMSMCQTHKVTRCRCVCRICRNHKM